MWECMCACVHVCVCVCSTTVEKKLAYGRGKVNCIHLCVNDVRKGFCGINFAI